MIVSLIPCSKKALSNFLEGVAMNSYSGYNTPDPIFLPLLFDYSSVACNNIMYLRASISKRCNKATYLFYLTAEENRRIHFCPEIIPGISTTLYQSNEVFYGWRRHYCSLGLLFLYYCYYGTLLTLLS